MINFLYKVPNHFYLACSGGCDSMAALDFYLSGKKNITVLYFNHSTAHSNEVEGPLTKYCESRSVDFRIGHISDVRNKRESLETYWRRQRYNFFGGFRDAPVVTCHHLDDAVETWIFSSLNGEGRLIPIKNGNYLRPLLITRKSCLLKWCVRHKVPFWEDISNSDVRFSRNYIRHVLMPNVLYINPGISKVIRKKYLRLNQSIAPVAQSEEQQPSKL